MFEQLMDVEARYEEVMHLLSEPGAADDARRFQKLMKEQGDLSPLVEMYRNYRSACQDIEDSRALLSEETDEEMRALCKEELADAEERKEALEKDLTIALLPKDKNDDRNVVVEIRAGAGGDEAALFAAEIYRMYMKYAEGRGWSVHTEEAEETGIGGMKHVSFTVDGQGAYSVMKYESGVHRVQRVPETESGGRIHTSTITVCVMPEAEEIDVPEIPEKDIRIDVMRASGNGGQCVNTTDSAVRLTHYPTGIVIYSQTEKSQLQNKAKAFELLRTKLYYLELEKQRQERSDATLAQIGTGDRSEKIRTYNFPQGRVTDHRINLTLYKLDKVMDGDLQELIDALMLADQEQKLAAQARES
ncbi:MAG: peptide chain release factor 1 [Lachnospiraceae bacterium]|nr:peptide chain release factor 1 [Lachnospiraceae bacterium]